MSFRIQCPSHPKEHRRFATGVLVLEDWEVDEYGNYIGDFGSEPVRCPSSNDQYECLECGDYAEVVDEG